MPPMSSRPWPQLKSVETLLRAKKAPSISGRSDSSILVWCFKYIELSVSVLDKNGMLLKMDKSITLATARKIAAGYFCPLLAIVRFLWIRHPANAPDMEKIGKKKKINVLIKKLESSSDWT